jgi:ParB family chromosome partitioning protein
MLERLAQRIDREHRLGEASQAKALARYRRCGELLLRAKRLVGRGRWIAWLRANVKIKRRRVEQYMELAQSTAPLDWQQWQEISGNTKPRFALNSGADTWFSPPCYIEAARATLGVIELDPASCPAAQKKVQARKYFDKEQDGLKQPWQGKVFLNPPYFTGSMSAFIEKLLAHYPQDVPQAIVITNNASDSSWWQRLAKAATCVCFPSGRTPFYRPDGTPGTSLQGQTIFYLGLNRQRFHQHFGGYGLIMINVPQI